MSHTITLRTLALTVLTLTVGVICVAAQDAAAPPGPASSAAEPVPSGMYERFTVIQKIRLGATTLVNPAAAEGAAVVYSYEPKEVLVTASRKDISDKISAGQVQFGQTMGSGTSAILRVDQKTTKEVADTIQAQASDASYSQKGKFLTAHPSLAGAKPSGEWIAWSPEDQRK